MYVCPSPSVFFFSAIFFLPPLATQRLSLMDMVVRDMVDMDMVDVNMVDMDKVYMDMVDMDKVYMDNWTWWT